MIGNELLPLMPGQHVVWVSQKLGLVVRGEENVGHLLEITGALDTDVFREAVDAAVQEAEALHMRVVVGSDGVRQRLATSEPTTVRIVDLSGESDPTAAVISWFQNWRWETIGVDDPERYRFALISLGPDRHAWASCFNHFVIDDRGRSLLARRVRAHLAHKQGLAPPPPPAPSFVACAQAYATAMGSSSASQAQSYWRERLANLPALFWPERGSLNGRYARATALLPADDGAKELASKVGVSWPQLLTAFVVRALARKFRQDCVLGVLLDLRAPAYRDAIGLFATPMPLVVVSPLQRPLASVAREIGAQLRAGYRWARFPIMGATSRRNSQPLHDAMFNFLPDSKSEWSSLEVSRGHSAPFVLTAAEGDGHVEFRLDHDTGALSEAEGRTFLADLVEDFECERRLYEAEPDSAVSRAVFRLAALAGVDSQAAVVALASISVMRALGRETVEIAIDASRSEVGAPQAFRFVGHPEETLEAALRRASSDPVPMSAPDAVIRAHGEGYVVDWRATTSSRIARRLDEAFVAVAGADLGARISEIAILSDAEVAALLERGRGPVMQLPEPSTLPALFAAQAARTPGATALVDSREALDYRGLAARVEDLAAALAKAGARRGDVIAVVGRREIATIVSLLAVQSLGGAFLPIDPVYPEERVAFMLADLGASLVLDGAALNNVGDRQQRGPSVADSDQPPPITAPGAEDFAYVMYTSGSTGKPKGVVVTQRALANLALWGAAVLGEENCRGMLFTTSLVFDVAMFEIFSPLVCGGKVLITEGFKSRISAAMAGAARVVSGSPTVLDTALRSGALPAGLNCVVTAGEALPRELADRLLAAFPHARLINAYGPTEATVYASFAEIRAHERGPVPIGVPLTNMRLYVLDRWRRLLPDGVEGDLWIGGVGVAHGYLHRPELNAERFVPNPFGPGQIYRSGDRARWGDNGHLEYHGREDTQLKIHGVRIEAEEIQEALTRQPEIAAAAVGLRGDGVNRALVAWIVARGAIPEPAVLRRRLAKILPGPVIPSAFVTVPQLPVTLSGKLDFAALPDPTRDVAAKVAAARAPSTPAERDMFDLWRETVNIPTIRDGIFGVDDNLFDLGADSLSAVRLVMEIGVRYGVDVPSGIFQDGVTVAALAAAVQSLMDRGRSDPPQAGIGCDEDGAGVGKLVLVRSARGLSRGDVIGMPALDGSTHVIGVIAANAFDDYDMWAFQIDASSLDLREGLAGLEHARALAEILASGRDLRLRAFVGFSFGGVIAWLTDRELVARGFPATPVINFEGYAESMLTSIGHALIEELLERAAPDARGRMLLLQRASPAQYEIAGPAEADWRSLGVELAVRECRTLTHMDLEIPPAIRAAAPTIADFIEFGRLDMSREEIDFDFDSFGGHLFHLANGPQTPTASELRAFLAANAPVPGDGVILHSLFALAAETSDPSLLLDVADIAVTLHPNDANIRARLGDACISAGDLDAAVQAYRIAISRDPASAHFHEALAHAWLLAGQWGDAVQALRQAFDLGGNNPEIYKWMGDELVSTEHRHDAEWAYRAAIHMAPDLPDAREALERLLNVERISVDPSNML